MKTSRVDEFLNLNAIQNIGYSGQEFVGDIDNSVWRILHGS